jgi:formylglycine-generating enzyme required for sulfatase activity
MAGKIFINYRRGDDPGSVQALFALLAQAFAPEQLFMDVEYIEPGLDFRKVLAEKVAECDVLIAVIGKGWIDARDEHDTRRLDNPEDFVRIEIESALRQGKRVIPLLVSQAQIPRADQLPEGMKPLATRNALRLTHERFRSDVQGLITALQRALKSAEEQKPVPLPPLQPRPWLRRPALIGAVIGTAIVCAAIGVWISFAPLSLRPPEPARTTGPAPGGVSVLSPEQELTLKPRDTFKECISCPKMIVVPPGTFLMGSPASEADRTEYEGPQHTIRLPWQFAVGLFALTFDEWEACVSDGGCNGYRPSDEGWGIGTRPVINVSWNDAKAYVAWLSKKTGKRYRLLSEAEREYVTRAGTTTAFWWGNSISTDQANYDGNSTYGNGVKGIYLERTVPVDRFAPNPWGLYQVHGNVHDWVEDCWTKYSEDRSSPSAQIIDNCPDHALRGGSWWNEPQAIRSASRAAKKADDRLSRVGVRVARTLLTP